MKNYEITPDQIKYIESIDKRVNEIASKLESMGLFSEEDEFNNEIDKNINTDSLDDCNNLEVIRETISNQKKVLELAITNAENKADMCDLILELGDHAIKKLSFYRDLKIYAEEDDNSGSSRT